MVIEQMFGGAVMRYRRQGGKRRPQSRLVLLVGAFCLALFVVGFAFALHSSAAGDQPAPTYVVQPGDTLWSIAKAYSSLQDDIRLIVYRIQKLNGLASPIIQPGQCLLLPSAP